MSNKDASTKILGFKYQEMVALVKCLEAKNNTTIYLECFGDISDGETSTEMKHSIDDKKELYDTHIDFWKTLGNLVELKDDFENYNYFVLHTTAKIKIGSIFEEWANISEEEKETKVLSITPNATINPHFEKVRQCNSKDLRNILNRFTIEAEQKNANEYYKDILVEHHVITTSIPKENIEAFVCLLLGYISSQLINSDDYQWKIDKNKFSIDFQFFSKNFKIDDLIFPNIKIDESKIIDNGYKFTNELKNIYYESKIGSALNDYFRAQINRIEILNSRKSLATNLDDYDDEILEEFYDLKNSFEDRLKTNLFNDHITESRRFYDEFLMNISNKKDLLGIKSETIKNYYPKGRTHHNIEENTDVTLKLDKEL